MRPFVIGAALALGAAAAHAQEPPLGEVNEELRRLRREMAEMEARHREEIDALRRELGAGGRAEQPNLQEQIDQLLDRVDEMGERVPSTAPRTAAPLRLVDVSLNALFAAGTSTASEEQLAVLQAGGHDPHKRGFTVQNVELVLKGAVDPYFNAEAYLIAFIDPEGETVVELEEAFATTSSLPWSLQAKAGQYFTEFGRHNPQHPHSWDFVDAPVVNTRFFGPDGMRGPGARLSWLAPTPFPLELIGGVQNANGETMVSFLGTDEEEAPAGTFVERPVRSLEELVWTVRAAASFDVTEELPVLVGASAAFGPSGSSAGQRTTIQGLDLTAKWQPLETDHGFPFVALQGEWMRRDLDFDSTFVDGVRFPGGELEDHGWYAQAIWGFARNWTAALRHDRANGPDDDSPGLDDRSRWSVALTFFTSEYARVRLQVNRDHTAAFGHDTSVWLQFEWNLGSHGAHKF